jgi:hypothetical protein
VLKETQQLKPTASKTWIANQQPSTLTAERTSLSAFGWRYFRLVVGVGQHTGWLAHHRNTIES